MEPLSQRRYRIVIALEPSEYAEPVLEHALDQAARHDRPDLHFLTVVSSEDEVAPRRIRLVEQALEGLDAFRAGRPDWRTRLHVRVGDPVEEIVGVAGEVDADLLVIGNHGLHRGRPLAERIIAAAPCTTLVVGVAGHELETETPCPACARVREES
jgi:nucleotide-binding universal stress UspA family protein